MDKEPLALSLIEDMEEDDVSQVPEKRKKKDNSGDLMETLPEWEILQ